MLSLLRGSPIPLTFQDAARVQRKTHAGSQLEGESSPLTVLRASDERVLSFRVGGLVPCSELAVLPAVHEPSHRPQP